MFIGAHVRTRGGYLHAAQSALAMGARSYQYFPMNPRSLSTKAINLQDTAACAVFGKEHGLLSIGHAPYALNPAVDEAERELMVKLLKNGLDITNACGSVGLVVHFGKYIGKDPLQGYKNIIQCLNSTLAGYTGDSCILLENQAGEGSQLGLTMEEMVQIRKLCESPEKIGFCLDTCHAYASRLWQGSNWLDVERNGVELDYFPHLKAVHLNDSLYSVGSRRDRHANIGIGHIGIPSFQELLASPFLQNIPIVLETGVGPDGTHRQEIMLVNSLSGRKSEDDSCILR